MAYMIHVAKFWFLVYRNIMFIKICIDFSYGKYKKIYTHGFIHTRKKNGKLSATKTMLEDVTSCKEM